jgi:hypothetical protein
LPLRARRRYERLWVPYVLISDSLDMRQHLLTIEILTQT